MLKLCQLIAAFWLNWLIVLQPAPPAMFALPGYTAPPVGSA